jgi:hypothetical protein
LQFLGALHDFKGKLKTRAFHGTTFPSLVCLEISLELQIPFPFVFLRLAMNIFTINSFLDWVFEQLQSKQHERAKTNSFVHGVTRFAHATLEALKLALVSANTRNHVQLSCSFICLLLSLTLFVIIKTPEHTP